MAWTIARTALSLDPAVGRLVQASVPIAIDAQTSQITVSVERPTALNAVVWPAGSQLSVEIVLTVDGVERRYGGLASGGRRTNTAGDPVPAYRFTVTPTWGFFGARGGAARTKRLGETAQTYTGHVQVRLRSGVAVVSTLEVSSLSDPAPDVPYRSSVAFDTATSGQDTSGDGTITLSHTASGTNRAAFYGSGNSDSGGGQLTSSITYAGVGVTAELWDAVSGDFGHCGAYLKAPATGVQSVIFTLAASGSSEYGCGVMTMTGVDQTTSVGTPVTASGSGANPSVDASDATTGDLVCDSIYTAATIAPGADQTERNTQDSIGGFSFFAQSTQPGASGGVMSWTMASAEYRLGAVVFKQAILFTLEQEGFRFRNDDGSESGATWLANQDVSIAFAVDTNLRVRVLVNATGDPTSTAFQLEVLRPGGGYAKVVSGSGDVRLSASANIGAGGTDATTAQLTAPAGKTTADFVAGKISDDTNPLPSIDITADDYTEVEFCVQFVGGQALVGVYTFRVTANGTPLDIYSVNPQVTIAAVTPTVMWVKG